MRIRSVVAAALVSLVGSTAFADDGEEVRFSAKELENVYLICAIHGAGSYMMPCVTVQIDKLKASKEAEANNKKMESLTRQEMLEQPAPVEGK